MINASSVFRQMVTSPLIFLHGERSHNPWGRIMKPLRKKNPGWRTGAGYGVTLQYRYLNDSRLFLKNQIISCALGVGVTYVQPSP